MVKTPDPIDVHVGSRVRLRRLMLSMSQGELAGQMDLTFQQVQKYEKGTNRIGASRLYHISQALDVPVKFFFDGLPNSNEFSDQHTEDFIHEFLASRDSMELARAYLHILDPKVRKSIVDIVRVISDDTLTKAPPFLGSHSPRAEYGSLYEGGKIPILVSHE